MDSLQDIVALLKRVKASMHAASAGTSNAGERFASGRDIARAATADELTDSLDRLHLRSQDMVTQAATAQLMSDRIISQVNAIISGADFSGTGPSSTPERGDGGELPPITRPCLVPDHRRLPNGNPKKTHPTSRDDRGHRRENEAAVVLARHGFDVIQAPGRKVNNKDPDFLINGRPWDCYSPTSSKVDRIRNNINTKVKSQQASRIILELSDSTVTTGELHDRLRTKPISGLDEIKIVDDDSVIDFHPYSEGK